MKTYTIVAGVNGCGKSSLTGVLRTEIDNLGKVIDVDKITAACGGNLLYAGDHPFRQRDLGYDQAGYCKGLFCGKRVKETGLCLR